MLLYYIISEQMKFSFSMLIVIIGILREDNIECFNFLAAANIIHKSAEITAFKLRLNYKISSIIPDILLICPIC
jgi:hypothetical protein